MNGFSGSAAPIYLEQTAKLSLFLPPPPGSQHAAVAHRIAKRGMELRPKSEWHQLAVALTSYRLGRFEEAASQLPPKHSVGIDGFQPYYFSLKSMINYRLGRLDEAEAALKRARTLLAPLRRNFPAFLERHGWHDWLIADLLFDEAESLFANRPSPGLPSR